MLWWYAPVQATARTSPGRTSEGRLTSRAISSPDSQCRPATVTSCGGADGWRLASATLYFAPYRETRGLSLMPPSTATKVRPPGWVLTDTTR